MDDNGSTRRMMPLRVIAGFVAITASAVPCLQAQGRVATAAPDARFDTARVTLNVEKVPLLTALKMIAQEASLNPAYNESIIPREMEVSLHVKRVPVTDAFEVALRGTGLVANVRPSGYVAIARALDDARSAMTDVTGKVTDSATHAPIAGATVTVVGTKNTVTTGNDGTFRIHEVPLGEHAFIARRLSYKAVTKLITIEEGKPVALNFMLASAPSTLNEVVTTAVGTKRRVEVGNQITRLDVDEIRKTAPITSVADILVGRVPGLTAIKASGSPGDPTRLRLRGIGSITQNNDPIVIVDGVRAYAAQSDPRNANATLNVSTKFRFNGTFPVAAPSPIDQIDPSTIETIEVLNGPSATSMYGSDAASGVIVITTKRGAAGPTRWTLEGYRGTSSIRQMYPDRYLMLGRDLGSSYQTQCLVFDTRCVPDTLLVFNSAKQGGLSPFSNGGTYGGVLSISGGTRAVQYNLSGSYGNELGILSLPDRAREQYLRRQGEDAPDWMRRPERYRTKRGEVGLNWTLRDDLTLAYTGTLGQSRQNKSSLGGAVAQAVSVTYADPHYDEFWTFPYLYSVPTVSRTYLSDVYRQSWDDQLSVLQAITGNWKPLPWAQFSGNAGINTISKSDYGILRRNLVVGADSAGAAALTNTNTTVTTVHLQGALPNTQSMGGARMVPTIGINFVRESHVDNGMTAQDLLPDASSMVGAKNFTLLSDLRTTTATFGTYVVTALNLWNQLFLDPSIRFDGGSTYGQNARLFTMPKLSLSWLASEAPFFSRPAFMDAVRFRFAYGQSGRQPGPLDRYRLFQPQSQWIDSVQYPTSMLATFGNTTLRPERSVEGEFGLDMDLFQGRFSGGLTWYNKITRDAIVSLSLPPSVNGGQALVSSNPSINLGRVRNSGFELSLDVRPIETRAFTWQSMANYSRNTNVLVHLNPEATILNVQETSVRYKEGYPLEGRWNRPMVSYADLDHDGRISPSEIHLADSAVFQGGSLPRYTIGWTNSLRLFNGALSITGQLTYVNDQTQVNEALANTGTMLRGLNDPSSTLAQQASAIMAAGPTFMGTEYAITQQASTLRFNSLSVAYQLPARLAAEMRAPNATISLEGSNLGMWSNYSGLDPNMNALSNEVDGTRDLGLTPTPRTWRLSARLSY